jgi:hypothetical protein
VISESAIDKTKDKDLVIRYFDPKEIPAAETRIICRKRPDANELDLSEHAHAFYEILENESRPQRKG